MANPIIHAQSSVNKFGGTIDDYIPIHEKMDCSKAYLSDNRHRALTHTMFWVREVMIPIFGSYIVVKKGDKEVTISVKDICEQHILEDFRMKFIPTVQDYLQEMEFKTWMQNGKGIPNSAARLYPELKEEEPKETPPETTPEVEVVKKVEQPKIEEETPKIDVTSTTEKILVSSLQAKILELERENARLRMRGGRGGYGSMVLD